MTKPINERCKFSEVKPRRRHVFRLGLRVKNAEDKRSCYRTVDIVSTTLQGAIRQFMMRKESEDYEVGRIVF